MAIEVAPQWAAGLESVPERFTPIGAVANQE
jgi:hypothetical protein